MSDKKKALLFSFIFGGELKTVKEREGYNQFAKEIGSEKIKKQD